MGDPNSGEIYEGALRSEGDVPMDSDTAARLRLMDEESRKRKLRELKELLDKSPSPSPSELAAAYDRIMDSQPDTSATPDARRGSDYRPDCEACRRLVAHTKHTLDSDNIRESPQAEFNPQPDLRTLEGAKSFLDYHQPDDDQLRAHHEVNLRFQELLERIWLEIPAGPGKTVLIRKLNEARMAANCVIANKGA